MPAGIWLSKFGQIIADAFGEVPYHVGSSLHSKDYRDVDVRLLLPDEEFARLFGRPESAEVNTKLAAYTLAFAALGQQMTGLPIDFQIQTLTHANSRYGGQIRSALIQVEPQFPESPPPVLEVNAAGHPTGNWVEPVDFDG
jgi:hypothetical protein